MSMEGQKQRTSSPLSRAPPLEMIPNPADLQGEVSDVSVTIRDPFTGDPLLNNMISQSQMDAVGMQLMQFWPTPKLACRPLV